MQQNKWIRVIPALQILLGLVTALLPFVLYPVCGPMKNGHYMSCHYSAILVTIAGVVLIALGLVQLLKGGVLWARITSVLQLLIALACYLIPHRIIPVKYGYNAKKGMDLFLGICGNPKMPCVTTFAILSWVLLAIGLLALVYFIIQLLRKDH